MNYRRAPLLLLAIALGAGCLRVDDISLGALERDAGGERAGDDQHSTQDSAAPTIAPVDAGTNTDPPDEGPDEDEPSAHDAGPPLDAGLQQDAGPRDAGTSDARVDSGADASGVDGGDGGAREPGDGGTDAARSLLCTFEPWHCL